MTSTQSTLARLSELLATIDSSADVLRQFIQQEQSKGAHQDTTAAYSASVADALGLPFHADPLAASHAGLLRIACERIIQVVTPPRHVVFEAAGSFYTSLALKIALRSEIPTLIDRRSKESGQEGVHVDVLSKESGQDADLLARLLRHLTVSGIFQEVEPNTFANTVASSTTVDNPEFNAHLDLVLHEGQLAAPFFPELMKQRYNALQSGNASGDLAPPSSFFLYADRQPFFSWLHSPQNVDRGKNFNLAMRGMSHTEGLAFLPVDYPFSALPADQLLVDVGGGIGSIPSLLLPVIPHLRFIVQDLPTVIAQAENDASPEMKRWIVAGRTKFEVQDCFAPQPLHTAGAIFIYKNVLHNWPDSKVLDILNALKPSKPSKLLIIDRMIIPYLRTKGATTEAEADIYNKLRNEDELTPRSQRIPTIYDLAMAQLPGGRTRTLAEWRTVLTRGGFCLNKIYPLRASTGQAVLEATISAS